LKGIKIIVKVLGAEMARQSKFEEFLRKFPEAKRNEIEKLVTSAPTTRQAFEELRKLYRYKSGYDTILSWKNSHKGVSTSNANPENPEIAPPDIADPIDEIQALHRRVNAYCNRVLRLLESHDWIEAGESRLSQRQAERLLIGLPGLAKTSTSGLIEMSRLRLRADERGVALGILFEFGEDWRRTLEHDNPELLPVFESVLAVTKARLGLDSPTVLDEMLDEVKAN
jgi:hypothetical protein